MAAANGPTDSSTIIEEENLSMEGAGETAAHGRTAKEYIVVAVSENSDHLYPLINLQFIIN